MKNTNFLAYYKTFAVLTFGSGLLLHSSRAIFGAEYFMEHILTLNNDRIFSIIMLPTAIYAWLAFKNIDFTKRWKKFVHALISIYVTISVPVHVKSWFTQDMKQIEAFPEGYSYIILPVLLSMFLFAVSLKRKETQSKPVYA